MKLPKLSTALSMRIWNGGGARLPLDGARVPSPDLYPDDDTTSRSRDLSVLWYRHERFT